MSNHSSTMPPSASIPGTTEGDYRLPQPQALKWQETLAAAKRVMHFHGTGLAERAPLDGPCGGTTGDAHHG